MTQGSRTADVCTRLSLLIKALVADRDAVSVTSSVEAAGLPLVCVLVAAQDRWRLLGGAADVARALRVLLDAIGQQQEERYALEINGVRFQTASQNASQTAPEGRLLRNNSGEGWTPADVVPVH